MPASNFPRALRILCVLFECMFLGTDQKCQILKRRTFLQTPKMDKLDIAIIRELTQGSLIVASRPGFAPSYRAVSKRLGVPFGTVRNRINAMYKAGVLKGSEIYPNPSLFNLKACAFTFNISSGLNREEVFKKLIQKEVVLSGHNFVGGKGWIVFFYEDDRDRERKLVLFKGIVGNEGTQSNIPFPPCSTSLSASEVQLILELTKNGLQSYRQLASKLDTSVRSLNRRISEAVKEYKILSLAKVDYSAIAGSVPGDALIFFDNDDKVRTVAEQKVLEIVKDYVIFAALFDVVGMCSLILPKVAQVSEIVEKIKQIEGVRDAAVEIVNEHVHQSKILVKYLIKEMASQPSALDKGSRH